MIFFYAHSDTRPFVVCSAMTKFTVHVEGLDEVQEALRSALPDRTARNVMKRVLTKRGKITVARAQAMAPRHTGRLRISIDAGKRLGRRQRRENRPVDPSDVEVFIAAGPLPWAHMMEYGTEKDRPQPFLRPAWDATRMTVLAGVKTDMIMEIEKAVARAAKKAAKSAG